MHASSPHDCVIIHRAPEDARVGITRQHERENHAIQQVVNTGNANCPPPAVAANTAIYDGSCRAFSSELRRVIWPNKFLPELPSRYDGTHNPVEFLTLYTIGI